MKKLVIEDESGMKGLIRQFLEDENYVAELADNKLKCRGAGDKTYPFHTWGNKKCRIQFPPR